jgi:hypothetical protein
MSHTHVQEMAEIMIRLNLLLQPLLCHRVITDIDRIGEPELCSSGQEHISNKMDHILMLPLANVHSLEQATVTLPDVQDIAEHGGDELLQLVGWGDYRWIGCSQWSYENGLDRINILDVHRFFADDFVDDTGI